MISAGSVCTVVCDGRRLGLFFLPSRLDGSAAFRCWCVVGFLDAGFPFCVGAGFPFCAAVDELCFAAPTLRFTVKRPRRWRGGLLLAGGVGAWSDADASLSGNLTVLNLGDPPRAADVERRDSPPATEAGRSVGKLSLGAAPCSRNRSMMVVKAGLSGSVGGGGCAACTSKAELDAVVSVARVLAAAGALATLCAGAALGASCVALGASCVAPGASCVAPGAPLAASPTAPGALLAASAAAPGASLAALAALALAALALASGGC